MSRLSIRMLVLIMAGSLLLLLIASAAIAFLSKQSLSTDVHHAKIVMQQNTALLEVKNLIDLSRVDALAATRGDGGAFASLSGHLAQASIAIDAAHEVFEPSNFPEFAQSASYDAMLSAQQDIVSLNAGLEALRSLPQDVLSSEIDQQILPVLEQTCDLAPTRNGNHRRAS